MTRTVRRIEAIIPSNVGGNPYHAWQDITQYVESMSWTVGSTTPRQLGPDEGAGDLTLKGTLWPTLVNATTGTPYSFARERIRVTQRDYDSDSSAVYRVKPGYVYTAACTTTVTAGELYVFTFAARTTAPGIFDTVRVSLATDAETAGYYVDFTLDNQWRTYVLRWRPIANGTSITVVMKDHDNALYDVSTGVYNYVLNLDGQYFKSFSFKKVGGSELLASSKLLFGGGSGQWVATTQPNGAPVADYDFDTLYNGVIGDLKAETGSNDPEGTVSFEISDLSQYLAVGGISAGIQRSKTCAQIATALLADVTGSGTFNRVQGVQLETGDAIDVALDGLDTLSTTVFQALGMAAQTEQGRWWVDPDGTARFTSRNWHRARGENDPYPDLADTLIVKKPADGDTLVIDGITYTWKTALTPTANQILIGKLLDDCMDNVYNCLTYGGIPGTDYAIDSTPLRAQCQAAITWEYPRRAFWWGSAGWKQVGNDVLPVLDILVNIGQYGYQNPAANGDVVHHTAVLDRGRYTLAFDYLKLADAGKATFDYSVDGGTTWTTLTANFDFYAAATSRNNNQVVSTAVLVPVPSYVIFRITTTGQNASSSGFKIPISFLIIYNQDGE